MKRSPATYYGFFIPLNLSLITVCCAACKSYSSWIQFVEHELSIDYSKLSRLFLYEGTKMRLCLEWYKIDTQYNNQNI